MIKDLFSKIKKEQRVTVSLIVINVVVFLLAELISGSTEDTEVLIQWGGAYVPWIKEGQYYRLFTSMFMHSGIRHLLNNMLLLYIMGEHLERLLGSLRFAILYLASGLIAGIAAQYFYLSHDRFVVSVGASGAIYGIIGALAWILIRCKGRADGLTMRQITIMLVFSLYFGAIEANVSNIAHISGLIGGFVLSILLYRKKPSMKKGDYYG